MKEHVKRGRADPYPEGKVLPVPEAVLESVSIILPFETAINVLEKARSFSLRDCECQITYKNCDKPLRTCLGLNELSDELVERGVAEKISLEERKKSCTWPMNMVLCIKSFTPTGSKAKSMTSAVVAHAAAYTYALS